MFGAAPGTAPAAASSSTATMGFPAPTALQPFGASFAPTNVSPSANPRPASVTPTPSGAGSAPAEAPLVPPSYMAMLQKARRDRVANDAFTQEFRRRFSAPTDVAVSPSRTQPNSAGAPLPSLGNASGLTAPGAAAANPGAISLLSRANEPQQQLQLERQRLQTERMTELLYTLQLCDSGFNNAAALPGDGATSAQRAERPDEVKGLHTTVSSVAVSAAGNLIAFIKANVAAQNQADDGEMTASSLFGNARRARLNANPTLLAAQCLYLLSRHFQLTADVVKDALALMDGLYLLTKNSLQGRAVMLSTFGHSVDTCSLNALNWLCVFSIVNMVAVWKMLRSTTGELQRNALIQSNVSEMFEATVSALRQKLQESAHPAARGYGSGLHGEVLLDTYLGNGSGSARGPSGAPVAVHAWQDLIDSYLCILMLAQGCLLHAKGSEQGYDKALEAFLGHKAANALPSAPMAVPSASTATHRGKVTKRMVQLAPVSRTLVIPTELIFITPYEMMSYLFDEMLPLVRHLSELEIVTHRRYGEQKEELLRMLPFARRGGPAYIDGPRGAAYGNTRPSSGSRTGESDMGEGLRRGLLRVGATSEVVGEPFTSEMAHLLAALADCLQHLPPEVLNPDLDVDCAVTFFIFKNFVKHLRQVFATQRSGASGGVDMSSASGALWENYTLKLTTKFLEVLAMIGRNPQYTQRVIVLLTDAQSECNEMQWHRLVSQALECAGFNSASIGLPALGSEGTNASSFTLSTAAAALSANAIAGTDSTADGEDAYTLAYGLAGASAKPRALHRQFTRIYSWKCQRSFISSFFLLLRQLFGHPTLRSIVSVHMNLEMALLFLLAPQQNQIMLGSTLSLVAALINNASDAKLVWAFLDQRGLLQQSSVRTQQLPRDDTRAATGDRLGSGLPTSSAAYAEVTTTTHEERLSLMGHCQYESTQGTYDITIGFLNLITALFQHDQPSLAVLPVYSTVTNFIAQDVLRGAQKRVFARPNERYTVVALAAAALRRALLVCFQGENGRTTTLPFASVMAINKAPTDVVGELLKLVLDASDAPYELPSHHLAAVRQALRLLLTAMNTVREQHIEMMLFDNRTTFNTDLAVRVLGLCALEDTLLTKITLQLLLLFPFETANQAAHYWAGLTQKYSPVLEAFTKLLHPLTNVPTVVQAPPELAQMDFEPSELVPGWPSVLLADTKSLLLDLLMRHADVTEPSLTAWMCGFYGEELSRRDQRSLVAAGAALHEVDPSSRKKSWNGVNDIPRWWSATLLTSVVEGACDSAAERSHPALAVKYVKLLYLLRANRLYGCLVIRPFLGSVCQTLFLRLQYFHANQRTPVSLSKYAYVLKLLALEACYTFRVEPQSLQLAQNTSITSIGVEVLLSLLHPFSAEAAAAAAEGGAVAKTEQDGADKYGGDAEGNGSVCNACLGVSRVYDGDNGEGCKHHRNSDDVTIMPRDAAVDITSWLPQALRTLPAFPEKLPPVIGGAQSHLMPCAADGVVQYNISSLYEAMQLEQTRANKPPLTMAELRERLRPFISANDCFFSYASGVTFVEGWCQLVSVSCSVVKGLSVSRLQAFALCILRGLDATTTMTAAAQEQVAVRLCHCLSTVMAHLRQTVCTASFVPFSTFPSDAEGAWGSSHKGLRDYPEVTDAERGFGDSACPRSIEFSKRENRRPSAGTTCMQLARAGTMKEGDAERCGGTSMYGAGHRRPREEQRHHSSHPRREGSGGGAVSASYPNKSWGITASRQGVEPHLPAAASRYQLAQTLLQRRQAERDASGDAVIDTAYLSDAAPISETETAGRGLLQALVRAIVQWGTRITPTRSHLYLSLLCLSETPGVRLDDVILWRAQRTLLEFVCTDICNGCGRLDHAEGVAQEIGPESKRGDTGSAVAGRHRSSADAALSTQMQHAVALLVALLQASAAVRDEFCNPNFGVANGMGTWAVRCATALLQSVDATVCDFFTSNAAAPLGPLLWHLRNAFDALSVISLGHSPQVLQSDLLRICFAMRAWQYSTQVVLGYSQKMSAFDAAPHRGIVEQNKEVLRRLLLGVVRWLNLLLSALGDAAPLLYEVQQFICHHRPLIDFVFVSPAAVSSATSSSARLTASHLTLCAELSDCLRALSSSVLALDCRCLIEGMALPELLSMLSSEEVWRRGPTELYNFSDVEGVNGGFGGSGATREGVAPSPAQGYTTGSINGGKTMEDGTAKLAPPGCATGVVPSHVSSEAAERGRDVVALTVRNLAHLLLNAEYAERNNEDAGVILANANQTPMLRHSASKRHLVVQILRQIAQALAQISHVAVCELRLECYLYALHAMVCLLHSFVLPVSDVTRGQGQNPSSNADVSRDFACYLRELPLDAFADALKLSQDAVYQLREFNTDYRGGMRGHRLSSRGWVVGGEDTASSSPRTLSNNMRLSVATGKGSEQAAILPKATRSQSVSDADAFTVPSTPGLLPAPKNEHRNRQDASQPPPALRSSTVAASEARPPVSQDSMRNGPLTAHAAGPYTRNKYDTSTTVVRDLGEPRSHHNASPAANGSASPLLPATEDGTKLQPEVTLWELLPQHASADSDKRTRLYDTTVLSDAYGAADGDLDSTGLRGAALQWGDVLNVENEVRQVKIAIANALRATKGAMKLVLSPP